MRQGPHTKRGRGRGGNNNRRSGTPNRNQTFDSNGPEVRIRGNANQVHEKYLNLARDSSTSGDRVLAESYFQHAEHYFRIISAFTDEPGADPNRNRSNGASQDFNNSGEGGQFSEGEPQPELNKAVREPRPSQPAPSEPADPARAESQTIPPAPATTKQTSDGEVIREASPELFDEQQTEEPSTRPALSLRRRRNGLETSKEGPGKTVDSSAATSPGVTVTVVGAPTAEASDPPTPAPRPRRKPRAAPPVERQEDSSDE